MANGSKTTVTHTSKAADKGAEEGHQEDDGDEVATGKESDRDGSENEEESSEELSRGHAEEGEKTVKAKKPFKVGKVSSFNTLE